MNRSYKLLALDLDGTLLDDHRHLPEKNIAALREAAALGACIMPATGRPFCAAAWVFETLGLSEGLVLSQAGALVSRYPSGETVFSRTLDRDFSRDLAEFCAEHSLYFHIMIGPDYCCLPGASGPEKERSQGTFGVPPIVLPFEEFCALTAGKADVPTPLGQAERVAALLKERFGSRAEIQISGPGMVDVIPPGTDKGRALLAAAQALGLSSEETAAFGDSGTDLPMIAAAGLGVCMENGFEQVKAAADVVAPANNDAGVAWAVEKYVLPSLLKNQTKPTGSSGRL